MTDKKVRKQIIILCILIILLSASGSYSVYLLTNKTVTVDPSIDFRNYNNKKQVGDYLFSYEISPIDISYNIRDQELSINLRNIISTTEQIEIEHGDNVFTTNTYDQFTIFVNDIQIPMTNINTDLDAFLSDGNHNLYQYYSIHFRELIPVNQSLYTDLNIRFVFQAQIYSNHSMFAQYVSGPDNLLVDFNPVEYSINLSTIAVGVVHLVFFLMLLISFLYFNKIRQSQNFETREDIRFHLRYFPYFVITVLTTPFLKLDPFNWIYTANNGIHISTASAVPWFVLVVVESLTELLIILAIPILFVYIWRSITFTEDTQSLFPTPDDFERKTIDEEDPADKLTREYLQLKYMRQLSSTNNRFIMGSILLIYVMMLFEIFIGRLAWYLLLFFYYLRIVRRKLPEVTTRYFNPDGSIY